MRPQSTAFALAALLALATGRASAQAVANASFESPALTGPGTDYSYFEYDPNDGNAWVFDPNSSTDTGGNGIAANGSYFGNAADAPDGTQVAFLQGNTSFSQDVSFTDPGTFTISFYAARRNSHNPNSFEVTLDGTPVTFDGATSVTPEDTAYDTFTSDPFSESAGTHSLAFDGLGSPGAEAQIDFTSFIDDVQIDSVPAAAPEPPNWLAPLISLAALILLAKRKTTRASS